MLDALLFDPDGTAIAAHLTYAMPAVSRENAYSGAELGINWSEFGRRGSFAGFFAI